jgi:hypothetical protein
MSSVGPVTSGSITAEETNSNSSGRSVLTANDAARKQVERERSGHNARYRVCNCSAHGVRPKGHSIKCPARPRVDGVKGPYAKTQGNEKHPKSIQLDLSGFPSRGLNPGASTPWLKKHYVRLPWTQGL